MRSHDVEAPAAYPQVHYLTAPLRAAARAAGDPSLINLWAGQAHALSRELPAAEVVERITAEAAGAAEELARRFASM
jgi:nitronate monooxygenase